MIIIIVIKDNNNDDDNNNSNNNGINNKDNDGNPAQNISNKIKKFSTTGSDQKTLMSTFAYFFTVVAKF